MHRQVFEQETSLAWALGRFFRTVVVDVDCGLRLAGESGVRAAPLTEGDGGRREDSEKGRSEV